MTISVKIVCDSVGPNGIRLTTFVLSYPRFIHSEFLTHRMFSRNASSSRAIPFEKQMKMIVEDPAMPLEFRVNQKGMQAGAALDEEGQKNAAAIWLDACYKTIDLAQDLADLGVHKQYVNRLIEPFTHISVVCTATEFSNFFALRHHSMAQPEIAELAKQMWELYNNNEPRKMPEEDWHLPFITFAEIDSHLNHCTFDKETNDFNETWLPLIKRSVARCARVSYNNHDGTNSTYEQDCALYDRLLGSQPIHASPAEHQAQALVWPAQVMEWSANFRGWLQYRQTLKDQNITTFEGPIG